VYAFDIAYVIYISILLTFSTREEFATVNKAIEEDLGIITKYFEQLASKVGM
jgi:hypothetical protein